MLALKIYAIGALVMMVSMLVIGNACDKWDEAIKIAPASGILWPIIVPVVIYQQVMQRRNKHE